MVEGGPFGRPAVSCGMGSVPGLLLTPLLGLPGVSRGCCHRGCLRAGLSGLGNPIILHEYIYVISDAWETFSGVSGGGGGDAPQASGGRGCHSTANLPSRDGNLVTGTRFFDS